MPHNVFLSVGMWGAGLVSEDFEYTKPVRSKINQFHGVWSSQYFDVRFFSALALIAVVNKHTIFLSTFLHFSWQKKEINFSMCKTRFELASISTSRPKRDPLDRSGTCTILSNRNRTSDQQMTINFYSLSLYQLSYAEFRQWQDLNLWVHSTVDFKSTSLTTRTHCLLKNDGPTRESNPGPLAPKASIIPLDQPAFHAYTTRLASWRDRTIDLSLTKRMLYQLS